MWREVSAAGGGGGGGGLMGGNSGAPYGLNDLQGWEWRGAVRGLMWGDCCGGVWSTSTNRPSHHKYKAPKQFL